jgi:predicted ATPase
VVIFELPVAKRGAVIGEEKARAVTAKLEASKAIFMVWIDNMILHKLVLLDRLTRLWAVISEDGLDGSMIDEAWNIHLEEGDT